VVELLSGLIFAFIFLKLQSVFFYSVGMFAVTYGYYVLMFSILLVIAAYDLKHKIIPDKLVYFFSLSAFIGLFFFESENIFPFGPHIPGIMDFLSGILIALPFALLWLISGGRWMGFGDAKLALGLGWFLGLYLALSGLVLAFWSGAIVGILLIVVSKVGKSWLGVKGMKSELPFAPFLVLGAFVAFICNLSFTF
jgi:leader peptidase (prepilin peptidase)/N-methyltransferase